MSNRCRTKQGENQGGDTFKGEAFEFLESDLRHICKRKDIGHSIKMTPRQKVRKAIKAKVRYIAQHRGSARVLKVVAQINDFLLMGQLLLTAIRRPRLLMAANAGQ
jgi:hypothetical protein